MKYQRVLFLISFALFSKVCFAQEPQFFLYRDIKSQNPKDRDKHKLYEMLYKLRDSMGPEVAKRGFLDIPRDFAAKNLLPMIGSKVYRFENSKFVGTFKVTKAMFVSNEEFGWYSGYLTSDEDQKGVPEENRESVEATFTGEVDVKKLKEINTDNNDYLESYSLNDPQIKNLKKKVIEAFRGNDTEMISELAPLPADWQESAKADFSLYLRIRKQTLAIFDAGMKWGPRLIAFKTRNKLFLYQGSNSTKFKQFIDWFGDYYVVISGNRDNYVFDDVFKLTPQGLVKVAEDGYAGD